MSIVRIERSGNLGPNLAQCSAPWSRGWRGALCSPSGEGKISQSSGLRTRLKSTSTPNLMQPLGDLQDADLEGPARGLIGRLLIQLVELPSCESRLASTGLFSNLWDQLQDGCAGHWPLIRAHCTCCPPLTVRNSMLARR